MTKPEFSVGDRVAWNYGIGKGKGRILEKVTKTTKFAGKNFKASPDEPKYLIKSDKGKELIRNPETLEMLLKEDVGNDNGDVEEMDQDVEEIDHNDAQEVPNDKDEDPTADIQGSEKKEEVKEALATQDRELEAKATEEQKQEVSKEQEVGGEPLQQMPGVEIKAKPSAEDADEGADLSKIEVPQPNPAAVEEKPVQAETEDGTGKDAKMDDVKKAAAATEEAAPHGLPHETVAQANLDAVI